MSFISVSCVIVLAKTWSTIMNGSDQIKHPYFVPDMKETIFIFGHCYDIFSEFFTNAFYHVEKVLHSVSYFLMLLWWQSVGFLSSTFSGSDEVIMWYSFHVLLVWCSILENGILKTPTITVNLFLPIILSVFSIVYFGILFGAHGFLNSLYTQVIWNFLISQGISLNYSS